MDNNDSNKNSEKIFIYVILFIIILSIGAVIYTVATSNSSLNNNIIEKTGNNAGNNNGNITNEDIDKMNVDKNPTSGSTTPIPTPPKTVEKEIATYTTTIYDKDTNRVDNITLAMSKLNNTVVKAGQEFSFNNTIGPMGEAQGYKKALGFDTYGNKIQTFGGGLCQISSTLYNSALIAGLEITERHPHSRRVYYVPKDKDATIYYGSLDFKFKNTTANDIKIVSTNDNNNVTVKLYKIELVANNILESFYR